MTEYNELTMRIEDKLEEALAMLAAGIPLETILAEAGEDAETLRPLLQMANETGTLRTVPLPSPDASLNKMLAYAQTLSTPATAGPSAQPGWPTRLVQPFVLAGARMATLTAIVLFIFLAGTVLGGSITLAAQDSLPGQRLYSLKRLGEMARLSLAGDTASRERLQETYNQRRRMEAQLLLQQGQETVVTFVDNVRSVDDTALDLDSLVIHINPETVINGELRPGARIQLEAVTHPPHTLMALTLTVIEPGPALPTLTSTPTLTPTPTMTPSATMTRTPTATPVISQGSDTLPALTPTQTPSIENDDEDSNNNAADTNENEDASSNDNNDDAANENEGDDLNENEDVHKNDDANDDDDDANDNKDDEDNSGSGSDSDNSGQGNSDDRDDDDKDDDKEEDK